MAKGAIAKEDITKILLETFNGSFIYDKNIVIPMTENGEEVHIKIAMTCSKSLLPKPGAAVVSSEAAEVQATPALVEPTEEEKKTLAEMLKALE